MKTLLIVPLLAVAAWLANPVAQQNLAQQKGKGKGFGFGAGGSTQLRLLENADVQKDLKLSESQVKTVGELSAKQKEALKDLDFKARLEKTKELTEANNKAIGELLNADQKKRLAQLEVQARGPRAFLDTKIAEDLGLKDEQVEKIRENITEATKKITGEFKGAKGNFQEIQKKMAELNKTLTTDIVKTLSEDQQKKWRDMTGPAFEGTLPTAGGLGTGIFPGGDFGKKKKKKGA